MFDEDRAPTPRRRRLSPEARREEILTAATTLISQAGYNAATLDDFARAAGISRAGLLHHFPSREALLEAVLDRRDQREAESIGSLSEPVYSLDRSRQLLDALVRRNSDSRGVVQLYTMLSSEALAADHPAHDHFHERYVVVRRVFGNVLAWHPEPDAAAVELISVLDGLQLTWLRDPTVDFLGQWKLFADRFFTRPAVPRQEPYV